MKSRKDFEGSFNAIVKNRLLESKRPQEEALFMLDTCCAACFLLAGAIEKHCEGHKAIERIVSRLERINKMIQDGKRKGGGNGHVEGDPEPYNPDDPTNRIIRP
jgi:hypothetical protein